MSGEVGEAAVLLDDTWCDGCAQPALDVKALVHPSMRVEVEEKTVDFRHGPANEGLRVFTDWYDVRLHYPGVSLSFSLAGPKAWTSMFTALEAAGKMPQIITHDPVAPSRRELYDDRDGCSWPEYLAGRPGRPRTAP